MTDGQDIFSEDEAITTTEGVSPEAPSPQPRDEVGRFAAKDTGETPEPAVEAAPPADAAPPAAVEKEPGMVPLAVVLDDREKRQRAEAEAAQLRAQLAHFQRQQQPPTLPDPIEDANGFGQYVLSQVQQATMANRLQMSRFFAADKYGAEIVAEAGRWLDAQPDKGARFLSEPSPWHSAVAEYQQAKAAEERASPDYESRLRAQIKAELLAEMQAPRPSPRVPPSMARSGNSGNDPAAAPLNPIFT